MVVGVMRGPFSKLKYVHPFLQISVNSIKFIVFAWKISNTLHAITHCSRRIITVTSTRRAMKNEERRSIFGVKYRLTSRQDVSGKSIEFTRSCDSRRCPWLAIIQNKYLLYFLIKWPILVDSVSGILFRSSRAVISLVPFFHVKL